MRLILGCVHYDTSSSNTHLNANTAHPPSKHNFQISPPLEVYQMATSNTIATKEPKYTSEILHYLRPESEFNDKESERASKLIDDDLEVSNS